MSKREALDKYYEISYSIGLLDSEKLKTKSNEKYNSICERIAKLYNRLDELKLVIL